MAGKRRIQLKIRRRDIHVYGPRSAAPESVSQAAVMVLGGHGYETTVEIAEENLRRVLYAKTREDP
jgi:ABC-type Zn uptake system ZnuABC Zn-binding protein ZnuA